MARAEVTGRGAGARARVRVDGRSRLLAAAGVLLAATPAWGREHGHEGCLSHHWSSPAYLGEIHLQFGLMACAAVLACAWVALTRLRRSRR